MSTNGWKPRKSESFTCSSGQVVIIKRPGPELAMRAGRIAKTFTKKTLTKEEEQEMKGLSPAEYGLQTLANMEDEELAAVLVFARELVCAMLVSPRLVKNPRPDSGEIGPDDIGDDFWELFNYGMSNYFNIKVPVGNQEVEIGDLESFRPESSVSGDSVGREMVRDLSEPVVGDQGLVGSP